MTNLPLPDPGRPVPGPGVVECKKGRATYGSAGLGFNNYI